MSTGSGSKVPETFVTIATIHLARGRHPHGSYIRVFTRSVGPPTRRASRVGNQMGGWVSPLTKPDLLRGHFCLWVQSELQLCRVSGINSPWARIGLSTAALSPPLVG